jgi:hypothetical protein
MIITQRRKWDCAVCCVAMAINTTWETAGQIFLRIDPGITERGTNPYSVQKALMLLGIPAMLHGYDYHGPLHSTIIQCGIKNEKSLHHYIWCDRYGYLTDPAETIKAWRQIKSFGRVISVPPL